MDRNDNDVQKLKTGISGLDNLFYSGIQLSQYAELDKVDKKGEESGQENALQGNDNGNGKENNGIVIAIRGVKGTHKLLLATQMLQGLTKEINRLLNKRKRESGHISLLYSLNKSDDNLQDLYLDLLLSKEINHIIKENINQKNSVWRSNTLSTSLFKQETTNKNRNNGKDWNYVPNDYKEHTDQYICDRTFYYNSRTNSLHFRRMDEGDDNENILFPRRHDKLSEYSKEKEEWPTSMDGIKEDFFNVGFNELNGKDINGTVVDMSVEPYYSESALQKFQNILSYMEEMKGTSPCIVIDGFAQFQDEELKRVPASHLFKLLRKKSFFSILIFDERGKDISCNADIIIDMRQGHEEANHYTFYELQITKSTYQTTVLGWHQYKERPYGVEVFPSVHRLLQRRDYLSFVLSNTHQSIVDESYEEYLRSIKRWGYADKEVRNLDYEKFRSEKPRRQNCLLQEMYARQMERMLPEENTVSECEVGKNMLEEVLLENSIKPKCKWLEVKKWKSHNDITALIGNPNSYKRLLANAATFNAARKGEHTLIILFDKEEGDVCRQTVCPGFRSEGPCRITIDGQIRENHQLDNWMPCARPMNGKKGLAPFRICDEGCPDRKECMLAAECTKCYEYIHFFGIRMGCISADELFSVIKEQLETKFENGECFKRVVIDDLQKVDFSFPLLKNNQLFLSALITLFREYNVKAQILCDKRAMLALPLCSMADNVVCIRREEEDVDKVTIYIERNSEHVEPSGIYRYTVKNIERIFRCSSNDPKIELTKNITYKTLQEIKKADKRPSEKDNGDDTGKKETCVVCTKIGSMKEYWRTRYSISDCPCPSNNTDTKDSNPNEE